jgi:transposase-like protein
VVVFKRDFHRRFFRCVVALPGRDAPGLSSTTISRLKAVWQEEYRHWQQRDLSNKRYAYFLADGIYVNVRMGDRQCLLVITGATNDGQKERVAIECYKRRKIYRRHY